MRLQLTVRTAWLLPILLAGCSSTVGSRFGGTPQSRSIAVVGDRPLPASTGEPGGRVIADVEEPEPKLNSKRRISGRVVDESGAPVPGATVRLADGGVRGGKEIQGTTDRTGAFTLNGLRPGSIYTLIAEGEDEKGPIQGRVEAKTAETSVEIALVSDEKKTTTRRSARPSKAKPISSREDVEGVPNRDDLPGVNREDVAPPSKHDDGAIDPGPPQPTRAGRPQLSPPEPGVGWKNSRNATASRPRDRDAEGDSASPDAPAPRRRAAKDQAPADPDEESNPLPPALDPDGASNVDDQGLARPGSARSNPTGKVGARQPRKAVEAGEIALAPEANLDDKADRAKTLDKEEADLSLAMPSPSLATLLPDLDQAPTISPRSVEVVGAERPAAPATDAPPTMPPVGTGPVQVAANEAPSPTPSPPGTSTAPQDVAPPKPAPQPAFASNAPAAQAVEKPASPADYNPFANLPPAGFPPDRVVENAPIVRPTSAEARPIAADEPSRKKWGELAAIERPPAAVAPPTKVTLTGALLRRMRPPAEAKELSIAACTYDARLRKINDFRLPDLEGKPVRFQDLDADLVLLDFWGTWCEPCLDAIPHLVELQRKYGPGKLKVVGIACEEVPPEQRRAKVDDVSRKLGINYPVLLSTMDGKPCPVQQALQIQAMPTMILVDRKGQVLWRNAGSTPENEGRLDRVLAQNLKRADSARR